MTPSGIPSRSRGTDNKLRKLCDGDDEAEAKEKALAEHVARHPEDVGRPVEDFNSVLNVIVRWPAQRSSPTAEPIKISG